MAQLGVLPTKNTIELREPDGDAGTIPAATESSAGVMTAGHVKMLREVYQRVHAAGDSLNALVPQLAPDMTQYVTRHEVQQVLSRLPAVQPALPPAMTIDVIPRVQALENNIQKLRAIEHAPHPHDLTTRMSLLEVRQTELESSLVEVATTVGEIEGMLRGLHAMVSIEDDEIQRVA